jgi:hypothetical protein
MISIAEGEFEASALKGNATRTIADAEAYKAEKLKNFPDYVLNYNSNIELYKVLADKEIPNTKLYVLQPSNIAGQQPSVVLPSQQ